MNQENVEKEALRVRVFSGPGGPQDTPLCEVCILEHSSHL